MKKRHVVLSAALIAMLALTGCGGKDQQQQAPKAMTAEEIITASNEAMNDLDSYGFTMNMDMQMDMKDQGSLDMEMVSKAEAVLKPSVLLKMTSDVTMNIPDSEPQTASMTQYIEGTDTGIALYQEMAEGVWGKYTVDDPALVEAMSQNPQDALESYKEVMEKAEIIGEEKVGDRDCYKVEMTLTQEALDQIMAEFNGAGLTEETLAASKEALSSAGGLSTVVWIDKENFQMLKQTMDISEIVRQAMIAQLKDAGLGEDSIGDVTMSMEILYDNYGGVSEIVIPDEARNAQEITM